MGIRGWFGRYVWSSKKGKAGLFLVVVVPILDNYTRIETAVKALMGLPVLLGLVHLPWFYPALVLVGLGLIYWSTRDAKARPIPKTVEERLGDLESGRTLPEAVSQGLAAIVRVDETVANMRNNVSSIPALTRRLLAAEAMLDDAALFNLYLSDLTQMITEVAICIDLFKQIRELHPGSVVADKPFSSWRPHTTTAVTDDALKDSIRWARYVEKHVEHLYQFCLTWHLDASEVCKGELFTYSAEWRNVHHDVSGDLCLALFQDHYVALTQRRGNRATAYRVLNFLPPPT